MMPGALFYRYMFGSVSPVVHRHPPPSYSAFQPCTKFLRAREIVSYACVWINWKNKTNANK